MPYCPLLCRSYTSAWHYIHNSIIPAGLVPRIKGVLHSLRYVDSSMIEEYRRVIGKSSAGADAQGQEVAADAYADSSKMGKYLAHCRCPIKYNRVEEGDMQERWWQSLK